MACIADPELTKAFQDLQVQVLNTREKVRHIEQEISSCERQQLAFGLTKKTIENLPKNLSCFIPIGRAFIPKQRDDIFSLLNKNIEKNQEKIHTMKQAKLYQESKVKETENNIREMIQQKKNASSSSSAATASAADKK